MSNISKKQNQMTFNKIQLAIFIMVLLTVTALAAQTVYFQKSLAEVVKRHQMTQQENQQVIKESRDLIIKILSSGAGPASNSVDVSVNQVAAGQRALDLGTQALELNQIDLAILYFTNGINHNPGQIELYDALVNASLQAGDNEALERAINLLEVSTLNVPVDDFEKLLQHVASLREAIVIEPINFISLSEAENRLKAIKTEYNLDEIWSEEQKLAEAVSMLEGLLDEIGYATLQEKAPKYDAVVDEAQVLMAEIGSLYRLSTLYTHSQYVLEQIDKLLESKKADRYLMVSLSTTAQALLPEFWGDSTKQPDSMKVAIENIPSEIAAREQAFGKLIALEYSQEIEALKKDVESLETASNHTEAINKAEGLLQLVVSLAGEIPDKDTQENLSAIAQDIQEKIKNENSKRMVAYQKWALTNLRGFLNEWNSSIMYRTENNALEFNAKYQLHSIDQALLTPDVSKVYGRAEMLFFDKISAKDRPDKEYEFAMADKKSLTDF